MSDLGSTNGVILNGQPVDASQVTDGSEIRLGNTVIVDPHLAPGDAAPQSEDS